MVHHAELPADPHLQHAHFVPQKRQGQGNALWSSSQEGASLFLLSAIIYLFSVLISETQYAGKLSGIYLTLAQFRTMDIQLIVPSNLTSISLRLLVPHCCIGATFESMYRLRSLFWKTAPWSFISTSLQVTVRKLPPSIHLPHNCRFAFALSHLHFFAFSRTLI